MSTDYCLVLCTCPDAASAEGLAEGLVAERLAACVNIAPGLTSVYAWEGRVEKASEHLLLIKTGTGVFARVEAFLKARHPYQVPEIVALPFLRGSADYLEWMSAWINPEA
jgi:periplasmic divalent cation tolerance protein